MPLCALDHRGHVEAHWLHAHGAGTLIEAEHECMAARTGRKAPPAKLVPLPRTAKFVEHGISGDGTLGVTEATTACLLARLFATG